jgi:hypothetical protein
MGRRPAAVRQLLALLLVSAILLTRALAQVGCQRGRGESQRHDGDALFSSDIATCTAGRACRRHAAAGRGRCTAAARCG